MYFVAGASHSEGAIHFGCHRDTCYPVAEPAENREVVEFVVDDMFSKPLDECDFMDIEEDLKTDFYLKNIQINTIQAKKLCLETSNQCNKTWRNSRRLRITGSICYDIWTYIKNAKPDWEKRYARCFSVTSRAILPLATALHVSQEPGHILRTFMMWLLNPWD